LWHGVARACAWRGPGGRSRGQGGGSSAIHSPTPSTHPPPPPNHPHLQGSCHLNTHLPPTPPPSAHTQLPGSPIGRLPARMAHVRCPRAGRPPPPPPHRVTPLEGRRPLPPPTPPPTTRTHARTRNEHTTPTGPPPFPPSPPPPQKTTLYPRPPARKSDRAAAGPDGTRAMPRCRQATAATASGETTGRPSPGAPSPPCPGGGPGPSACGPRAEEGGRTGPTALAPPARGPGLRCTPSPAAPSASPDGSAVPVDEAGARPPPDADVDAALAAHGARMAGRASWDPLASADLAQACTDGGPARPRARTRERRSCASCTRISTHACIIMCVVHDATHACDIQLSSGGEPGPGHAGADADACQPVHPPGAARAPGRRQPAAPRAAAIAPPPAPPSRAGRCRGRAARGDLRRREANGHPR
jgi:hypothetical protein